MQRIALLVTSVLLFCVFSAPASASHFRSGNLSWQKSTSGGLEFQNTQAWRRDSFGDGTGEDGLPIAGDTVSGSCIETTEDTGGEICPQYKVTFANIPENYVVIRAIAAPETPNDFNVPYTPTGTGPFTAITSGCCTISDLLNWADGSWTVGSTVDLANDSQSPRSSVPPIVNLPSGGVQQFRIPVTDPGGQTLRFKLTDSGCRVEDECTEQPQPPGLAIDEATGVVSWDTTSRDGLWWTGVEIDGTTGGNVVSSTQIQYIIRVGGSGTNSSPVWDAPTPEDGTTFTVLPGQAVSFDLVATDPDSGDSVQILQNSGPGTTTSTDGNPGTAHFVYTPNPEDVGKEEIVQFLAQDMGLLGPPFRSFKIKVVSELPSTPTTTPPADTPRQEQPVDPAKLTLSGTNSDLVGDTHSLEAAAVVGSAPLAGRSVRFNIAGANPTAGAATTNGAGKATISWKGAKDGRDTVSTFLDLNSNGTADAGEPTATSTVDWLAPPTVAKTANVEPVSGNVFVKLPAGAKASKYRLGPAQANGFIPLKEAKTIPLNSTLDTTGGKVEVNTAIGTRQAGRVQSGQFYEGMFQVKQIGAKTGPITEMLMNDPLSCSTKNGKLNTAATKKKSRGLWGNGKGRFRTRGRHSSATVRGTIWYTKDTCTTTTTVVRQGTVTVQDFVKKKTVTVKAGKKYVARAKLKAKKKKR